MRQIVLLTGFAAVLAACTQSAPAPTGLANPASEYCASLGGRTEIRNEAGGQVGYCQLPDGSITEEWALYRARVGQQ
ncbi:DUF333 domain-containing protein [Martelella lutilitoris]|uniref:DUF333 domain-containing protein n=1 Tax=Martelella lutilitoris TaxID=2583532 RepID=A0A5C4JKL0_9HYPH|nr:DUF333 domain-containing protein [Martelella lutilitoris]TNB46055.1 DUF333 domain-containing protein [Martelella lutilitoris]